MGLSQLNSILLASLFHPILHRSSHVNYSYAKVVQRERGMKPGAAFPRPDSLPVPLHKQIQRRATRVAVPPARQAIRGATSEHRQRRVLQAAGRVRLDKMPCYAARYGLRVY